MYRRAFITGATMVVAFQVHFVFADPPLVLTDTLTFTTNQANSIVIDQISVGSRTIDFAGASPVTLSGNILDDPNSAHTAANPLTLDGIGTISGSANTYTTGTVIAPSADITLAPGSTFGSGLITNNGTLHLTSTSNVVPGQTINLTEGSTLTLGVDEDLSTLLNPASFLINIVLDTDFTHNISLDPYYASLSASRDVSYEGTSLTPYDGLYLLGIDPFNPSAAPGMLTIANSVLVDTQYESSYTVLGSVNLAARNTYSGGNRVIGNTIASASGALGTGWSIIQGGASLSLSAPHAYGSTMYVEGTLAFVGEDGVLLSDDVVPALDPFSTIQLGDGINSVNDRWPVSVPIALCHSTLLLKGIGTSTQDTGAISVFGVSNITFDNSASSSALTILHAPSLSRVDDGIVMLQADGTDLGEGAQFILDQHPATDLVVPYVFSAPSAGMGPISFATYGSNGFAATSYVNLPATPGTGTEIVDIGETDSVTISANTTLQALRTGTSLNNPSSGPVTLQITSGAMIIHNDGQADSVTIAPNLNFGNVQAVIVASNNSSSEFPIPPPISISGKISTTGGLVKAGEIPLDLSNSSNQITGDIAVLQGTLQVASLGPSDPGSNIYLNPAGQASFMAAQSLTLDQSIYFGAPMSSYGEDGNNHAGLIYRANLGAAAGQTLTCTGQLSGNAALHFVGAGTVRITGNMDVSFLTANPEVDEGATLILDGSMTCSIFYVDTAGTLTGTGSIIGSAVITDSATVSPGDHSGDIATLILGSQDSDVMGTYICDIDQAGQSDLLRGGMYFSLIGHTTLDLNSIDGVSCGDYLLISATNLSGTFENVLGMPTNYYLDYSIPGQLWLRDSVPEPHALTLTATALCLLFRRRSRHK